MVHKKLSPLYILAVLIEKSDYDHPMTQPEIIQEVSRRYGLEIERKAVSDTLKAKGINCARRTVNKYRKELDIDSSFERAK